MVYCAFKTSLREDPASAFDAQEVEQTTKDSRRFAIDCPKCYKRVPTDLNSCLDPFCGIFEPIMLDGCTHEIHQRHMQAVGTRQR